ncbi:MAG: O-antigen ligase family protein [Clostridia bacterium]|nr:O-antigen ligase family protein [Clostridia bacterium]
MLFVMLYFVMEFILGRSEIITPVGFVWLLLCVLLNTLFCFNSLSLFNAFAYDLWFIFDAFQIIVIVYYFRQTESVESITKKYIYCFVIMAVIGLMQVILQYAGINFFVTQVNDMHRANGFSYEPSYYVTYMLMGWCICMYLFEKGNFSIFPKRRLAVFTLLITVAMVLSTSRMGWIMMVLYIGVRLLVNLNRLFVGRITIWKIILIALIFLIIAAFILVVYGIYTQNETVLLYLNGLGLGGTSAHSSSTRINGLLNTLNVFLNNPIIGVSLGGVDPAICYEIFGWETYENGSGVCVFAEVLAAFGVFGFVFFMIYLYKLIFGYRKIKCKNKQQKQVMASYAIALVFILIILQMNQNILRPVLWAHIAILSAIYSIERNRDMKPKSDKEWKKL